VAEHERNFTDLIDRAVAGVMSSAQNNETAGAAPVSVH
jgi:hypothetical protein